MIGVQDEDKSTKKTLDDMWVCDYCGTRRRTEAWVDINTEVIEGVWTITTLLV